MSGITKQVGKYMAASRGGKNMGSQPSGKQMSDAKSTALGRGGTQTTGISRGSLEGLKTTANTRLSVNGSGYDSTKRARMSPRSSQDFSDSGFGKGDNPISRTRGVSSNVFDYTYSGTEGNSISMMKKQRQLDKARF